MDDVQPTSMAGTLVCALILLLTPALADASEEAQVGRRIGGWERTSEHTPT